LFAHPYNLNYCPAGRIFTGLPIYLKSEYFHYDINSFMLKALGSADEFDCDYGSLLGLIGSD
jgi:hypothetical protein